MAKDYLSMSDNALCLWLQTFLSQAAEDLAGCGLSPSDAQELQTGLASFSTALTAQDEALRLARGATRAKKEARQALLDSVRRAVRIIDVRATMPEVRAKLGLPALGMSGENPGTAVSMPLVLIDESRHRAHRVRCTQDGQTARPRYATGWELWMKVLAADADRPQADHLTYQTTVWSRWHTVQFEGAQIGARAWYCARWVGRYKRQAWKSEFSNPTGAIILG